MSGPAGLVAAIVQARMTSSRLSGKILLPLAGKPLLYRMLERVMRISGIDKVVLALAEGAIHDAAVDAISDLDVLVVRGSEQDVLARTAKAAREARADTVMRITSDCPLLDPGVSGTILQAYADGIGDGLRYARTAFDRGFPLGFDTEVFSSQLLYEADRTSTDPYEREHATPYIWRRPERFPQKVITGSPDRRDWRLVVDTADDYNLANAVYDALHPSKPQFGYRELIDLFEKEPQLLRLNAHVEQRPYVGLA
jgi:spore coat polysaccharide biosynthesis protein SpsF